MKKFILGLATLCFILFGVVAIQNNVSASTDTKIVAAQEIPNFDKDKDKDKDKKKSDKDKCSNDCAKTCCDKKGKTDKNCQSKSYDGCCSKSKSDKDKS